MKNLFKKSLLVIMAGAMVCTTSCNTVKSDNQNKSATTEETVIHLAVSGNGDYISKEVKQFNEANNGYKIELICYEQNIDESADSLNLKDFELIQDIINKTDIDIVSNYCFIEEANYKNLQQKGAFADLYQFMANDTEINTQTLNSHILQLNETNGLLCSIPTFYTAYTIGGNPEYVGTKANWTFDEMMDYWDKMPDNATIQKGRTKEWVYYQLVRGNLEAYVDYANGEVNFDSADFRNALEFCNTFDYNNEEKTDYDYEAPNFCYECQIPSFMSIASLDIGSANPKVTFVGYPNSNGNGAYLRGYGNSFSISAKSDENKQKGAWEFIRTFFTEEWQTEHALSYSDASKGYASQNAFCMNNKAQENIKNNTVNKVYAPETSESKGETFTTDFPTIEDCNALESYLNSINRWGINTSDNISYMVEEEVFSYFSGEISIDECISRIQNRCSIWISEQA